MMIESMTIEELVKAAKIDADALASMMGIKRNRVYELACGRVQPTECELKKLRDIVASHMTYRTQINA